MRRKYFLVILLSTLAINVKVFGQLSETQKSNLSTNEIFVSIGLEPEWVSTIGYTHLIGNPQHKVNFRLGASLKLVPLAISNNIYRFNVISQANYKISNSWGTKLRAEIYDAHDNDRIGVLDGLGFELRSRTFHYGKRWNHGIELGWQYTALTHIKNSAKAKDTFKDRYPDKPGTSGPKDGWYASTVNRFRLGYMASRNLGQHLQLLLGGGGLLFIQHQGVLMAFPYAQVPLYVESSLSYHW